MSTALTQIRKATALGALLTSLTLLAACSSGSDNNSNDDTGTNTGDNTTPVNDTTPDTDPLNPNNTSSVPGTEGVVGNWTACNDVGGLRLEYTFTDTMYEYRFGVGTCAGFESAEDALESGGSYSITGTTMSDSGLTAFTMELTQETLEGFPVFESAMITQYVLAYTGTPNELVFSGFTNEGEDRSLTLNFDTPYVRF
ncbi:MAG: hypothetical protein AB8B97_18335 [Granulosicoccus sp.]